MEDINLSPRFPIQQMFSAGETCSIPAPPTKTGGIYPKHQPQGDEGIQARVIQLEALFKGEVGTGEDLAQGELQHSQSTLHLIV